MNDFAPIVNLNNQQILTLQNYKDLGFKAITFSLEALLIKPGFTILINQESLKKFVSWPYKIYLTAKTECINLKSTFDGQTIKHGKEEIEKLIIHLKPDKFIFNHECSNSIQWAMEGKFVDETLLDLTKPEFKEQFNLLSKNCSCPTCKLNLTRAYLHHLFKEVPLLTQRYLAMHNLCAT